MSSVTNVFLGISPKFSEQLSYLKVQSYFHKVGNLEEMDRLLKDLIRSALSLVIITIANLKLFSSFWDVWFGPLILKKTSKIVLSLFSNWWVWLTHPFSQWVNVGWRLLFHIWCKTIKLTFLFPVSKNAAKMCV